jgi:hypothetical protein
MKFFRVAVVCCLAAVVLPFVATEAGAAELTRGPYLQTATPDSITVRWRTDVESESIVLYGTESDRLHWIDGDIDLATEHEVRLYGLTPSTKYYYSIGSLDETHAGGPDHFFITHPTPGRAKPTRVWAIGDCGTATWGGNQIGVRNAYYNYAGSRYTDVWLALGDNAYYSGTDEEYQANFFDIYPTLLRQSALWSTIGNHETYSVAAGQRIPYQDIFSFPEHGEAGGVASGTEKYYSFDYANIHFVCLDSELSDRSGAGPMLTWLQADLASNTNEWLIVFWHSPPYSKGSHNSDNLFDNGGNMTQMRANAAPLIEAYGADLVLCGHSHIYERSFLLRGHYGFSDSLQPTMIVDPGSGRPADTGAYRKPASGPGANEGTVYVVAGSSGWATFRTGYHPAMFMDELQMGSLVLDINSNRLDAVFLRETGAIDDSFTIIKGPAEPLRLCTFQVKNGQTIARWKSLVGQSYQIERTSNLENPNWFPASASIRATGATTSWTNAVPNGDGKNFYRVVWLAD